MNRFASHKTGLCLAVLATALATGSCFRGGFGPGRDGAGGSDGPLQVDSLTVDHLGLDLPDADIDQATGDSKPPDLAGADSMADPLTPFGAPQAVSPLNTAQDEDDPTLTADMLEIFFDRSGDIWQATRPALADPWGTPQPVTELNTLDAETSPELSPDGLVLYFASDHPHAGAQGGLDVYVSARSARNASWGVPVATTSLNTTATDFPGSPTADMLTMVLSSTRSGGLENEDLFQATRVSAVDPWGTPVQLAGLTTTEHDTSPWLSPDGLVLCFDRGPPGLGTLRAIWITTRTSPSGAFAAPVLLQGVTSPGRDSDAWISPDYRTIYFASNRDGTKDIFKATR